MLANTENVDISSGEKDLADPLATTLDRLTLAMDQFTLSLLSTTRHHEQLSDFQVRIGEVFENLVLKCLTIVMFRQQVSRVLHQVVTILRDHELKTLLLGQRQKEISKGVPLECLRPLKEKEGGRRPRSGLIKCEKCLVC